MSQWDDDPQDEAERARRELPTSLVPRWLAALVLVALLAAGALSAWLLLRAEPPRTDRAPATRAGQGQAGPR